MATSIELREKLGPIVAEIRQMADMAADAQTAWTPELEARWVAVNEQHDALMRQIERLERAEELEAESALRLEARDRDNHERRREGLPEITEETRALALQAWCLAQSGRELRDEHTEAARACRVNLASKELDMLLRQNYREVRREFRALSTAATAGGDTIPEGFVSNFEIAQLAFGGVRRRARVLRTATGNDLPWPTVNDTGNAGAILAENTQDSEQDIVTAALVLNAYKYTSKIVRVSNELLQDSAFNLANELGSLLGERIARITNTHFTTGTGTGQPKGLTVAGSNGKTLASNSAITVDELIDLLHSVDQAYRNANTAWMMRDATVAAIRKLKTSGGGEYIWQPSQQAGEPERLLGYPIEVNGDVPAIGTTAKSVIFGDFSKYIIRDVLGISLLRMVERYADYHQEGFVAFSRHDGDLLNAGTNPIKFATHPV